METRVLLNCLLTLQSLEFDDADGAGLKDVPEKVIYKTMVSVRLQIPLPILNHYDRQVARGKRGVAAVRHQTCTGCHAPVTEAVAINLRRGEDIQACENCGRYLYLPEPDLSEMPAAAAQKTGAKLFRQAELFRAR